VNESFTGYLWGSDPHELLSLNHGKLYDVLLMADVLWLHRVVCFVDVLWFIVATSPAQLCSSSSSMTIF
jgi:hypothetical protein